MSPFEGRMYIHFKGKAVQYSCAVIAIDDAPRAREVTFVIQQAVKTNTCIKWYHSSAVITTYTYTLNCMRSSVLRRPIEALTLEGLSVVLHKSQRRWEGEAGLQLLGQMKTMPRILHRSGFGGGGREGERREILSIFEGREEGGREWNSCDSYITGCGTKEELNVIMRVRKEERGIYLTTFCVFLNFMGLILLCQQGKSYSYASKLHLQEFRVHTLYWEQCIYTWRY